LVCDVSSDFVSLGQIKTGYDRLFHVSTLISGKVSTFYFILCHVRSIEDRLFQVMSRYVRLSGYVMLFHVKSCQVISGCSF